ncbi:MAG TPA: 4'-phosphopantetheinyl transferase superfamily protein [Acidimicrobiales bacterium]|nr:4'-phosphopantetheinyl transferase superfamily protein [Acidimicrobiales bacterium]
MNELAAALDALGARVGVAVATAAIEGAGRAAERAAADAAAVHALRAAGDPAPEPPTRAADGRPCWPHGFTGSLAHAGTAAVAAAAADADIGALGIDLERDAALSATDAALVLTARERGDIAAHQQPDRLATLMWSAKEAAFKAWSTATCGGLGTVDPVDISVDVDDADHSLRVHATGALSGPVDSVGVLRGAFAYSDGYVLTLLRADPQSHPPA